MNTMTTDEARCIAALAHYDTLTVRGPDYCVLLLKDGQPILDADGLPVQYRNRNEAGIDMRQRAAADVLALDPSGDDPAPETGLGSGDDEGDTYDEEVCYAAAA